MHKILGFATLILFAFGIIYVFFIHEEPEPERLPPAKFKQMEKIYQQGEVDDYYPSDPYRFAP